MDEKLPPHDDRTLLESVDKADLKPLYETNHNHIYARDPADETDDYIAEMCTVKGCNLGRLIAK